MLCDSNVNAISIETEQCIHFTFKRMVSGRNKLPVRVLTYSVGKKY